MATRRRPENLTAYDCYLRAVQQFYPTTREGMAEAIRLAHRALELDPGFGTAEWGFAIGQAFWGTGLFVEAAELVLAFAFDLVFNLGSSGNEQSGQSVQQRDGVFVGARPHGPELRHGDIQRSN